MSRHKISVKFETPSYASTRSLSVPDIKSKKEIRAIKKTGRKYTWIDDKEFMADRVYLSVDQINRMMEASGKERYEEGLRILTTEKYKNATDEGKVEILNEIASNYNSSKEYDGNRFRNHTIALFDILQEIYDAR